MLRLNLNPQPAWIDLFATIRVKVVPITSVLLATAYSSEAVQALPDDTPRDVRIAVLTKEIARLAIIDWEGVGDESGAKAVLTPEAVGCLMDMYQINKAFQFAYVAAGFLLQDEKKGSGPLPQHGSDRGPDPETIATTAPADAPSAQLN